MKAVPWVAVIIGSSLCLLYLYWFCRIEGLAVRRLRWGLLLGVSALMAFLLIFTLDYLRLLPQRTQSIKITEEVTSGKKTWHKYLCINCHTLMGNGAYYAPDLTRGWDRFLARAGGDELIARQLMEVFLMNPPQATSNRRGMPRFGMKEEEARGLVSFLRWVSFIDTNGWPPEPLGQTIKLATSPRLRETISPLPPETLIKEGESLFLSRGCSTCHTLGLVPKIGPDLIDAARRHNMEYLIRWIQNPETLYNELGTKPINQGFPPMPELGISEEEARAIAVYLSTLSGRGGQQWGS
jgi:nitric oxide reductase subunit C